MQNVEDYKEFDVLGANLLSILDGFGSFTLLASKILLEEGLGTPDDVGMAVFQRDKWYPLYNFLRAFNRISAEFGDYTLRQVGIFIPKHAVFMPSVKDVTTAFQAIDIGYHFNHGKKGKPMFDPTSGEMLEGIGHYKHEIVQGKKQIICEVDTPYPCAFDHGMVTGLAQRFEPTANVVHDAKVCRKRGAQSCLYNVSWK